MICLAIGINLAVLNFNKITNVYIIRQISART